MNPNLEHNEGQPVTMKDVEQIMTKLRPAKSSNTPILAIRNREIVKGMQGGLPREMYHATLDPMLAINEDQVTDLTTLGYVSHYIPRDLPRMYFRRNMDPRYALKRDPATGEPVNHEYVEERMVRTAEQEAALLKEKPRRDRGEWFKKVTDIPPLETDTGEDSALTIARLEGENRALKGVQAGAALLAEQETGSKTAARR